MLWYPGCPAGASEHQGGDGKERHLCRESGAGSHRSPATGKPYLPEHGCPRRSFPQICSRCFPSRRAAGLGDAQRGPGTVACPGFPAHVPPWAPVAGRLSHPFTPGQGASPGAPGAAAPSPAPAGCGAAGRALCSAAGPRCITAFIHERPLSSSVCCCRRKKPSPARKTLGRRTCAHLGE